MILLIKTVVDKINIKAVQIQRIYFVICTVYYIANIPLPY